jgi:hypothetical protein
VPGWGVYARVNYIPQPGTENLVSETETLIRLWEQLLELVTVFKEANRNLIIIFLFPRPPEYLKLVVTCTGITDLNWQAFKKSIHLVS